MTANINQRNAGININPVEGLKLRHADRPSADDHAGININPVEGLKQDEETRQENAQAPESTSTQSRV